MISLLDLPLERVLGPTESHVRSDIFLLCKGQDDPDVALGLTSNITFVFVRNYRTLQIDLLVNWLDKSPEVVTAH